MANWNPWHGCTRYSEGCANCAVYRIDEQHGRSAAVVQKTAAFGAPIARDRAGAYRMKGPDTVYTCFSSDFFHEAADGWRPEAWAIMRERHDLHFFFITKRIERFYECIPADWGAGYPNVTIACTVENSRRAAERLPIYTAAPLRVRIVICEPLLTYIDLSPALATGAVDRVSVGGESGPGARVCDFDWVLAMRDTCVQFGVPFTFRQTGARLRKDGRLYSIPRARQAEQARRAGIDYAGCPQDDAGL